MSKVGKWYKVKLKVAQSHPTLCNTMDYIVHGILQARILEWVAIPFSRGIFPTQGWNPDFPHWKQILYQQSNKESPRILEWVAFLFSRGSSHPGIEPRSPSLQADSLPVEPQGKSNAMVAIKCDYRCHSNKHGVPIKCPPMFHYYAPGLKGLQMGYMKGDCQ